MLPTDYTKVTKATNYFRQLPIMLKYINTKSATINLAAQYSVKKYTFPVEPMHWLQGFEMF